METGLSLFNGQADYSELREQLTETTTVNSDFTEIGGLVVS